MTLFNPTQHIDSDFDKHLRGLRRLKVYIPEYPNVTPQEAVKELI